MVPTENPTNGNKRVDDTNRWLEIIHNDLTQLRNEVRQEIETVRAETRKHAEHINRFRGYFGILGGIIVGLILPTLGTIAVQLWG